MTVYVNHRNHTFKKVFTDEGIQHKMLNEFFDLGWIEFKQDDNITCFINKDYTGKKQFVEDLSALPQHIQNELRPNLLALRNELDFGFQEDADLYNDIDNMHDLRFVLCWLVARGVNIYMVKTDDNTEFFNLECDRYMKSVGDTKSLIPDSIRNAFPVKRYISPESIIRTIVNNDLLTIVNCDEFGMCTANDWHNPDVAVGIKSLGNRQDMTQPEIDDYMSKHYNMKPAMVKYY